MMMSTAMRKMWVAIHRSRWTFRVLESLDVGKDKPTSSLPSLPSSVGMSR